MQASAQLSVQVSVLVSAQLSASLLVHLSGGRWGPHSVRRSAQLSMLMWGRQLAHP